MSAKTTELTSTQVQQATGLSRSKLRFWTDGRVLNIKPSISSGRQGASSLFSIGDYYMVCLAQAAALENRFTFTAIGLAIDAIANDPRWEQWAENRGRLIAQIARDNSVRLLYDPVVKPETKIWDRDGELQSMALVRAIERQKPKREPGELPQAEPLTPEKVSELRLRLREEHEELRKLSDGRIPPWEEYEKWNSAPMMPFELREILGEADQRLAKVLG